jgi:predicted branched-subunit amino acid permease
MTHDLASGGATVPLSGAVGSAHRRGSCSYQFDWEKAMDIAMDAVFLVLIIAFFASSAVLVRFCAGLMDQGNKS